MKKKSAEKSDLFTFQPLWTSNIIQEIRKKLIAKQGVWGIRMELRC